MQHKWTFAYITALGALFLAGFTSASFLVLKPLIVGALIDDYHFSSTQAGFVAGIEMIGVGVASLFVATFGSTSNRRRLILIGATLGVIGSVFPFVSNAYIPILIMRLIAGFGCGLIAPIVLAIIGTARDPDRTFGLYYLYSYGASALLMAVGSWCLSRFHVQGAYALLTILLLSIFALIKKIPEALEPERKPDALPNDADTPWIDGMLSLGLSFVFWIGFGALWAFVERLGLRAGLSQADIGTTLSTSQLSAIAGALITSFLHTRYGRFPLLVSTIILSIISVVLVGWSHGAAGFVTGVLLLTFIWPIFLAYLGGLMATIDQAGRVVAMSVTSQTLGMALGSAMGGVLAGQFGYGAIGLMGLVSFGSSFIFLMLLAHRLRLRLN